MARRLSVQKERAIVEAYEAWDPGASTLEDLIAKTGVSRQTVYTVLRRHGIELKTVRPSQTSRAVEAEREAVLDGLDRAMGTVLDRLEACVLEGQALKGLIRALADGRELTDEQARLLERTR